MPKPTPQIKKSDEYQEVSEKKTSRLSDVANNTIIKMESGENDNPTLETLRKVAKALGVSIEKLIN